MSKKTTTRRGFFQSCAVLTAASFATPAFFSGRTAMADSPNERFTMGYIGCGGIGHWDAGDLARFGDIVAFCDVDDCRADEYKNNRSFCSRPESAVTTRDYRKVLDRDDIQVVGIATPDHWHVKIAIEAMQAGKHVFCQKPLTLTIAENQLIRDAIAKYSKQFQVGTQQRTDRGLFMTATAMIRKGLLGQIKKITVGINGSDRGGPFNVEPVPSHLDWNQWLGQAPTTDYIPQRCHANFRWWYEYSGGKFTDWGAHHIDIAQWALGEDQPGCGPIEIDGTDCTHNIPLDEKGNPTRTDSYNTATDFAIKCKFASGTEMIVDSRSENGILFEGTNGRFFVNRGRLTGKPIEDKLQDKLTESDFVALYNGKPVEGRMENFFRCIREGGLTVSDPVSHTIALNTCHLCGIAGRLKRTIRWDPKTETIPGDALANSMISREQRKGFELPSI